MLSIRGEGKKQYLYQLKQWWNEENFYDVETL